MRGVMSGGEHSRRARASVRARLLALGLGVALLPLAAELGYRLLRSSGLSPTTNPAWVRHDPELGWSYRPGARERHAGEHFDVEVAINAQGFRGADWDLATGGRRVLVLGDSFAFGWGVEADETFAALIDAAVPELTVYNAAVSGYGTDQQRLLLERLLPEVRPDLVVVVFCWNDLDEIVSPVVYGKHKPWFERGPADTGGRLVLRGVPVPDPPLERWSMAWRAFVKWRWQRADARRSVAREAQWRLALDLVRVMQRLAGEAPLLVVSDRRRLADLARHEPGIEHFDVREAFAGHEREVTFPDDGHWTPAGHERLARALLPLVRQQLEATAPPSNGR
jgi:lysophospholipase L1-like esterase